jgi:hypothetical protein
VRAHELGGGQEVIAGQAGSRITAVASTRSITW